MEKLLKDIIKKFSRPKKLAAVMPYEDSILSALEMAANAGVVSATLIGNKEKLIECLKGHEFKYEIINEEDIGNAIGFVKENKFELLMKGSMNTDSLLHAVFDKERGLKTDSILSHVALFEIPSYKKLLIVTDAGVNIRPDLMRKASIIDNALAVSRVIGVKAPKVAVLAAVEKVIYPAMPATRDADMLREMSDQGRFKDARVEGPFALDNAVSEKSVKTKGIKGSVAGDADILMLPDIESANILYKSLTCFAKAKVASIVVGAKIPLVVPSRADDPVTKYLSILLAAVYSENYEKNI